MQVEIKSDPSVKPIVIVTGVGRCGTSFVAQCFQELGMNLGHISNFENTSKAGLEAFEVVDVNNEMMKFYPFPNHYPSDPREIKYILSKFETQMRTAIKGRDVVKDPRFCKTLPVWLASGLVKEVIMLKRDHAIDSVVSTWMTGHGMASSLPDLYRIFGQAMWTLLSTDILYHVYSFPSFINDPNEAFATMIKRVTDKSIEEVKAAIAKVYKPEYVVYSTPGDNAGKLK
jgi:hypothetical protein